MEKNESIPNLEVKKEVPKKRKRKTVKDKVIETLEITEYKDLNRPGGGLSKTYDLGIINPEMVVIINGRSVKRFHSVAREKMKEIKNLLKEKLGDDYPALTVETRLIKPKMKEQKERCSFKVVIIVYGQDFERVLRRVGKNKNVKYKDY